MQKERYQSQINQNFETVCHTEVYLSFSRLAAKLSGMIAVVASKFNLDRPLTSMASKMARANILKIASNHMNVRERLQKKNQTSSAGRSVVIKIPVHKNWNSHPEFF